MKIFSWISSLYERLKGLGAEPVVQPESRPVLPMPVFPAPTELFLRQPGKLRGHGYVQGETFDIGINKAKRAIKAIKNKRERKAARTRFIQRLRDSGIK